MTTLIRQRLLWSFSPHWATKSSSSKDLRIASGCMARLRLAVVEDAPHHDNRSVISGRPAQYLDVPFS